MITRFSGAWSNNLLDTDKVLKLIYQACAASTACALCESTAEAVGNRVGSILDKLKYQPIPVIEDSGYGVVDWDLAWKSLFHVLYNPYALFPIWASALADVEKDDGRALYHLGKSPYESFECDCKSPEARSPLWSEAHPAIACGDGDDVSNESMPELIKSFEDMSKISSFANIWAGIHINCVSGTFLFSLPAPGFDLNSTEAGV